MRPRLATFMGIAFVAAASACGGGGGGASPAPVTGLQLVRGPIPVLAPNEFATLPLGVSGGVSPYSWSIVQGIGSPPTGMTLGATGVLSGTPTTLGTFAFQVQVFDSAKTPRSVTGVFSIPVGGFDFQVFAKMAGDLWVDTDAQLTANEPSPVTFSVLSSPSGGGITFVSPQGLTITYHGGSVPATDVVRCTRSNGEYIDVKLHVRANPLANHVARFGTTDVWFVRLSGKSLTIHSFVSDFDWSLTKFGLRAVTSTGIAGTEADQLAKFYVQLRVLRRMNEIYRNGSDGTPLAQGLKISFPYDAPGAPHLAPGPASFLTPTPGNYNIVGVQADTLPRGLGGLSIGQDVGNTALESLTVNPGVLAYGVFIDYLLAQLGPAYYGSTLVANPVGAGDLTALKAMIYGLPDPGGRYAEIKATADGWSNLIAHIAAHEMAHSLGLVHTGGVMSLTASVFTDPALELGFTDNDATTLSAALPGPGR